jgi:D-amino-acid oxidase
VRTRDLPNATTSCAAGAIWGPARAVHDRAPEWGRQTLEKLTKLARCRGTGVRIVSGVEACRESRTEVPPSLRGIAGLLPCTPPTGFATAWRYTAPLVNMPIYLAYLGDRLRRAGGRIEPGVVRSLEDVVFDGRVLVNCTGYGARDLVPDHSLVPMWGQVVVVDNPGIDTFFAEVTDASAELTYFLPHGDHVILGSTAEPWLDDPRPRSQTAADIVRRCATVEPALAKAEIRGHRAGIRPVRPTVRVERTEVGGRTVIHNYGHGAAGVSLSWGCAFEVRRLLSAVDHRWVARDRDHGRRPLLPCNERTAPAREEPR